MRPTSTLRSKYVTTRKPHRCAFCSAAIPVGDRAHYWAGVYDGEFQSNYGHRECQLAWELSGDDDFIMGEFPIPVRIRDFHNMDVGNCSTHVVTGARE
jgi:hypothetical protein